MITVRLYIRRGAEGIFGAAALFFIAGSLQAQKPAVVPKTFGDDYAGSEMCQICHEDNFNTVTHSNPHRVLETDARYGFQGHVCESCHGPGAKHAATGDISFIRFPSKLSAAETDKMCLNCHLNQQTHAGRIQSTHAKNAVTCTACHKMHVN